jgi:hypothetical protein
MQCLLLAALPSSVLFPYRTLFKYDAIPSPRCLVCSCDSSLLKSYSNVMHYPLLVAQPHPLLCSLLIKSLSKYDECPLVAALPPPVLVSY